MSVTAAILDLNGTLLTGANPVPGVPEMVTSLQAAGLRIAVASNEHSAPIIMGRLRQAGIKADLALDHARVRANKGSPEWTRIAMREFDVRKNEIIWLGDSNQDMWSAVNAGVAYFHATWSSTSQYGIPAKTPALFSLIVRECFMKPVYWYWQLSTKDSIQRYLTTRAMLDGNGAQVPELKNDLLSFLKYGGDPDVGPMTVRELMMLHLIGSIYGEGLHDYVDTWTTYPGSAGSENVVMGPFMQLAACSAPLHVDRKAKQG